VPDISPAGLAFIRAQEGLRLTPYLDQVGIRTVGYGHARWTGGDITLEQAEALLLEDLRPCEACINSWVDVELTQGAFDALCSFSFNVGTGALINSTLLKLLNGGDYQGAADQFLEWCHGTVNGVRTVLPALLARRTEERRMFLVAGPPTDTAGRPPNGVR
jgi:lysozyme